MMNWIEIHRHDSFRTREGAQSYWHLSHHTTTFHNLHWTPKQALCSSCRVLQLLAPFSGRSFASSRHGYPLPRAQSASTALRPPFRPLPLPSPCCAQSITTGLAFHHSYLFISYPISLCIYLSTTSKKVNMECGKIKLSRFTQYPNPKHRWSGFGGPKL